MNRLITFAAWAAALATVLWQRVLRPALRRAFTNFDELFPPAPAPIAVPLNETHESHRSLNASPAARAPRRRGRPRRAAAAPAPEQPIAIGP